MADDPFPCGRVELKSGRVDQMGGRKSLSGRAEPCAVLIAASGGSCATRPGTNAGTPTMATGIAHTQLQPAVPGECGDVALCE